MSEPSRAVFLSYASEDALAAQRIAEALRSAGIEVWFDQSELRGGDIWDQRIRHEIRDCALFLPMVSRHTQERLEGYFRREWKLAIERRHDMAEQKHFLVPVVVDSTDDRNAVVPDAFRAVHWTRLPGGATPPAFVERIKRLLFQELPPVSAVSGAAPAIGEPARATWRSKPILLTAAALVAFAALAYLLSNQFWIAKHATPQTAARAGAIAGAFAPPPHSIAVMPFVNMSGDKEQEYFSEGLTEELLNSLSRINELQVAARTSSFSFEGEHPDISTIAHKLNVAAILEGSVRRSAHTVRITAQLINGATGFHLWSQTYDRSLGDVLALQTEIATSVAKALKVALVEDTGARIELGGTRNPAAFDAYLRGKMKARTALGDKDKQEVNTAYTEAIALDPHFAMAFAERSIELTNYANWNASNSLIRETFDKSLADASKAVSLAPDLAEGHYAMAVVQEDGFLKFALAHEEFERALALAPGSARFLSAYSRNAAELGHAAAASAAARRAVMLDPLNFHVHRAVGIAYLLLRQNTDAIAAFRTALSLEPDYVRNYALLGQAQFALGDFAGARSSCEASAADDAGQYCLALVYWKLGRKADAEAIVRRIRASRGDDAALDLAAIYAQRGDIPQALEWLDIAVRQHDSGLHELRADPNLDPLRKELRFQAIERQLNFPD